VCACLLKTAEARTGCCTSLLYGMTRASKNNVKGQLTLVGVRELRLAVVISKGSDDGRRSDRERDDQVTQLCGIEDVCHAGVTSVLEGAAVPRVSQVPGPPLCCCGPREMGAVRFREATIAVRPWEIHAHNQRHEQVFVCAGQRRA
jgi:hypothetical protein